MARIRGKIWVHAGLWTKVNLFLTAGCGERGEAHQGGGPTQGRKVPFAHTAEPESLGGALRYRGSCLWAGPALTGPLPSPGPSLQGQSPAEHGVHVLRPDRLRQRPTEQVQPALPSAPGRLLHLLAGTGVLGGGAGGGTAHGAGLW